MGDTIYFGYDVINILGVKLFIEVCNVLNSCDSMHTDMMSHVLCLMSYREWVWYN